MKTFNNLQVSIQTFSLRTFDKFASLWPPPNASKRIFIKFCPNFGEKIDKILKLLELASFPLKFSKN